MHTSHRPNVFGVSPHFGDIPVEHHFAWPKVVTSIVAAGIVVKDAIFALAKRR